MYPLRKAVLREQRRLSLRDRKESWMSSDTRRCCGIDVHKKNVTVCVLPPLGKPEAGVRKRTFRTLSRDLKQLRIEELQGNRDRDGIDRPVLAGGMEHSGRAL